MTLNVAIRANIDFAARMFAEIYLFAIVLFARNRSISQSFLLFLLNFNLSYDLLNGAVAHVGTPAHSLSTGRTLGPLEPVEARVAEDGAAFRTHLHLLLYRVEADLARSLLLRRIRLDHLV